MSARGVQDQSAHARQRRRPAARREAGRCLRCDLDFDGDASVKAASDTLGPEGISSSLAIEASKDLRLESNIRPKAWFGLLLRHRRFKLCLASLEFTEAPLQGSHFLLDSA